MKEEQKKLTWRSPGYEVTEQHPVSQVSWNDAIAYCHWLSTQEQAVYRMPTEAEWEYACRAGTTSHYSFGDDEQKLEQYGWYNRNVQGRPAAVGAKLANGFGLHDMHGNLFEWCQDIFDEAWYERTPTFDPRGRSLRTRSEHITSCAAASGVGAPPSAVPPSASITAPPTAIGAAAFAWCGRSLLKKSRNDATPFPAGVAGVSEPPVRAQ